MCNCGRRTQPVPPPEPAPPPEPVDTATVGEPVEASSASGR